MGFALDPFDRLVQAGDGAVQAAMDIAVAPVVARHRRQFGRHRAFADVQVVQRLQYGAAQHAATGH